MASIDLKTDIKTDIALASSTIATNTTTVGNEINTFGYQSVTFGISTLVYTDGNYVPSITESDTAGGAFTEVADEFLIGTEAEAAIAASNTTSTIGYNGSKQFVKLSIVSAGTTIGCTGVAAIVILGSPRNAPTS